MDWFAFFIFMIIRKAKKTDFPDLLKIFKHCFEKFDIDKKGYVFKEERIELMTYEFIQNANGILYVCEGENKIIGYVLGEFLIGMFSKCSDIKIISLNGDPSLNKFKQAKIMMKLLSEIENLAIKCGVANIFVQVNKKFDIRKLFTKRGFILEDYTLRKEVCKWG